jgi:hypothetical protein
VFAVQTAGVLLQRVLPRDRHGQHQGVERRMVESFADQLAVDNSTRGASAGRASRSQIKAARCFFDRRPYRVSSVRTRPASAP